MFLIYTLDNDSLVVTKMQLFLSLRIPPAQWQAWELGSRFPLWPLSWILGAASCYNCLLLCSLRFISWVTFWSLNLITSYHCLKLLGGFILTLYKAKILGLLSWPSGWESWQCRGCGFDPRSGRIPRAMEQLNLCTKTLEPVSCN